MLESVDGLPVKCLSVNPRVLLVLSRALRSLGTPLIAFLLVKAPELSGGVMNPVSFCNVLFLGNLCAALVVASRFGLPAILRDWLALNHRVRIGLVVNGCLAVVISALIFRAVQETTVTNTVLLGRLGPVLYALLGSWLLGQQITKAEWVGFGLIGVGVMAIAFQTSGFQELHGDLLIMASTVVYALSAMVSKRLLSKTASLRVVVFSRNLVSAVVFFAIALHLFGPHHFGDIFSGQLWIIMAIYGLVVIVISQFAWFAALRQLDASTVARWTVLSPVFGVVYAFLLNGEQPSMTQGIAFVVIMAGVLISSSGKRMAKGMSDSTENGLAAS